VEFSGFESAPDALQIASREDNVLVANIEVKSGSFASLLTICLPLISLENFLQEKPTRLSHNMRGSSEERAQYRQLIEAALRAARLPMTVQFPPFLLKTEEIAGLQVGQVIHTGHPSDVPIELHVRGTRRFLGTLGQSRRCLGMRITQVLGDAQHEAAPRSSRGRMV
jgi:flagellar motor switch protein FliM